MPRSEWVRFINEWCFNEKHRRMLELNLLDGKSYLEIAEEVDMSLQQTSTILQKAKRELFDNVQTKMNAYK